MRWILFLKFLCWKTLSLSNFIYKWPPYNQTNLNNISFVFKINITRRQTLFLTMFLPHENVPIVTSCVIVGRNTARSRQAGFNTLLDSSQPDGCGWSFVQQFLDGWDQVIVADSFKNYVYMMYFLWHNKSIHQSSDRGVHLHFNLFFFLLHVTQLFGGITWSLTMDSRTFY